MNTKKHFTIKLLPVLLLVMLLGVTLAACNTHPHADYDYLVEFNYNLGKIDGNAPSQYLGLLEPAEEGSEKLGSKVLMRPDANNASFREATVTGYYLEGWYLPELDEEGDLVLQEDGRVKLGKKWDFEKDRVFDEKTVLYANLKPSSVMRFLDVETGAELGRIVDKPGVTIQRPTSSAPQKQVDGTPYTFLGEFYTDAKKSAAFPYPYTFGEGETVDVYMEFMEGEWELVRTVSAFKSALSNGRNIYLLSDIVFGANDVWSGYNYNGELNGNGFSVKGVTVNYEVNDRRNPSIGLFGEIYGRAYIHDVSFVDVKMSMSYNRRSPGSTAGLFACYINDGAVLENVTFEGTFTCPASVQEAVANGSFLFFSPWIGAYKDRSGATHNDVDDYDKMFNCDYSGMNVIYED